VNRATGPIATDRPAAVIVGLDCITGLQSTRLLTARGIPVIGVVADRRHFCARTRLTTTIVTAPLRGEPLVDALVALAARLDRPAVLIPCTDAAVLAISAGRDRLAESYRFVLPDHADVERLMGKISFAEHALAHGLPIPPTVVLRSREDAERAARELAFPAVLKPDTKHPGWTAATKAKAIRVETPDELLATYDDLGGAAGVLVAQTWVDGPEDGLISVNAYYDRDSVAQASFVARKLRQWPLDTGTSCLGEEIRHPEASAVAEALFGSVAYRGLGYVEAKTDARPGRLVIIEPNIGRPTGRSAIAERGGVELLLTAYRDALGEPLPEARVQRYGGAKWIYWRHDLQASLVHMRRGELGLLGWWRSIQGSPLEAVFARRDPAPFAADVAQTARMALGMALRRLTSGRRSTGREVPDPAEAGASR
jgi:predicted ATP-grasp superfamily ATP-dependent carboligase